VETVNVTKLFPDLVSSDSEAPAPPEPPEDGAALLDAIESYVTGYVRFANPHQGIAVALWVAHSWVFSAAETTPYLLVTAPERQSGKTRLAEVVKPLVRNGVMAADATGPTLFRVIKERRATLLLDEIDMLFSGKLDDRATDLAAILNSGYRLGGNALRCVGEGTKMQVVEFPTFSAKLLSGRDLGRLPGPLVDRSIPVKLQRKAKGDGVRRYRHREAAAAAAELADRLERWAKVAVPLLEEAEPALPEALSDRQQDGWEPLLAIAELAGEPWPERARTAALELHAVGAAAASESDGVRLLTDIRAVFDRKAPAGDEFPVLSSQAILGELILLDARPWALWWAKEDRFGELQVKAGSAWKLARTLEPYEIEPKVHRRPGPTRFTQRGYHRAAFELAWSRYCPSVSVEEADGETT
jgi:Protein of unknown function (DUF3631)